MIRGPEHVQVSRLAVRHRAEVLATLLALVGDLELAEDLLQDTLVEIIADPSAYDESRPFVPWARGIARNLVRRHWRDHATHCQHQPRLRERLAELLEQADAEAEAVAEPDLLPRLRACLDRLGERSRRLLQLRYGEDLLGDALADRVGMPRTSVRTTLLRVRRALLRCLQVPQETVHG